MPNNMKTHLTEQQLKKINDHLATINKLYDTDYVFKEISTIHSVSDSKYEDIEFKIMLNDKTISSLIRRHGIIDNDNLFFTQPICREAIYENYLDKLIDDFNSKLIANAE